MLQQHAAQAGTRRLGQCPASSSAAAPVHAAASRARHRTSRRSQLQAAPGSGDAASGSWANSMPHGSSSSSSSSEQLHSRPVLPSPPPEPTKEFIPAGLTKGLQKASNISALQHLWSKYHTQFNSFHFSALMQQLTRLHEQVAAAVATTQPGPRQHRSRQQQQAQHQQQDRDASLAELEQELGHLLDSSSSSSSKAAREPNASTAAAAATAADCAAAPGTKSSRRRRASTSSSRGLAGLVPAIDGYELPGTPTAAVQQQQQPRQRLSWRSSGLSPQTPAAAGSDNSSTGPWRPQQQPQAPKPWQAKADLRAIHSLARTAAATALQPDRRASLDHRALVMVAHNLAKMQLQDASTSQLLLQALGPEVLPELDPQQLTNLVWAVGVLGSSSAQEDSSPYRLLLLPAALRSSGPVVAVAAAAAAVVDSSSSSSQAGGGVGAWEQVPAVAELVAGDSAELLQAAAAIDTFADAVAIPSPPAAAGNGAWQPPEEWLTAAADALLQQLPGCSSQGVSMGLWGFAQLGFSPPAAWWEQFWVITQDTLQTYSPQDLALLMCAVGKLGAQVPAGWLSAYCSAACDVMPAMSSQQLTMCLWGLACAGAAPHKAFVLLWFLSSIGLMGQATTQELSMWLYALALLRITPSPSWCSAFVEASFAGFTAPHTRPQDLVTAMWSISRLVWSPPLLYWRGLMEAARSNFDRFGPQDLANCVSAASAVDVGCVSDAWLSAFIKASQARLSAFEPVQLAHTANALAVIARLHPSAFRTINAAWQAAFVGAARRHLAAGRLSLRNLVLVVTGLRVLRFKQAGEVAQFLEEAEAALAAMWAQQQQQQQTLLEEPQAG